MSSKNEGTDVTKGSISRQLITFFIPVLVGAFFQQLYNTVDTVIVGQFAGTEALSSVGGSSATLINLIIGFFTGLSSGCSIVISQFYGAGEQNALRKSVHTAYAFSIAGGILFGVLGILIAPVILTVLNTPSAIMASSLTYIRIYFAGLVFVFIYNMGSAVFRAAGDSRRPFWYLIISSVINIFLDLLLVCGAHLGVAGVAIATVISQGISSIFIIIGQSKMAGGLQLQISSLRIDAPILGSMLRIGLPSGLQASMYSISNAIVQAHLNTFGIASMAAWSTFGKIDGIFWMINNAFGISIATFVGQNYGARKADRIRKAIRLNLIAELVIAGTMSILVNFYGPFLFRIFTSDEEVIQTGMIMISILSPFYFSFVFVEQFADSLRAEGCVLLPTLVTVTGVCLFRIVWLTWVIPDGELRPILWCYPITWILCAVIMTAYYLYRQPRILKFR